MIVGYDRMKIGENLHRIGRVKSGPAFVRNQHRFTETTVFTGFAECLLLMQQYTCKHSFNIPALPKAFLSHKNFTYFCGHRILNTKHHP